MCKRVVLPALSRPRNKSLACLFHNPKDESMENTKDTCVNYKVTNKIHQSKNLLQSKNQTILNFYKHEINI